MSIHHEKYTSVLVDEYLRYTWSIFTKGKVRCPVFIYNHKDHLGKFVAKADDGYFLGYSIVSKGFSTRRKQSKETFHVIFNDTTINEITDVQAIPEVIVPIKLNAPQNKETKGPPELINTQETNEQIVQTKLIETPITDDHLGDKSKPLVHILKLQSLIWLGEQNIELVNIICKPTEGMLTKSMAAKFAAASTNKCIFADFLYEVKPKKVSEVFMNKMDEYGTIIGKKERVVAQGYMQEKGIEYDET
ncbi:hypothetical protein Tco_1097694, partial [Tanacetum coccineum]